MSGRRSGSGEVRAPADLRLVLPALGGWAGCLVALWAPPGVAGTLVVLGIAGSAVSRWRGLPLGFLRAALAVLILFAAGAAVTLVAKHRATTGPLAEAAADGARVTVDLQVTGDASELPGTGFDGSLRYRLPARTTLVERGSRAMSQTVELTVIGTGPAWADLLPGEHLRVEGRARPDRFSAVGGPMLVAGRDPIRLAAAPWWQRAAGQVREQLVHSSAGIGGEAAGLLPGIVVGDRAGLSAELQADSRTTGLAHLLAVSGSHVAILCGAAAVLLRRWGPRASAMGGGLLLVVLVIVVRPGPAVLRAALMGGLLVLALLLGRTRTALPALAAVVIGLLLTDPQLAVDAGFALSVCATAALVVLAPVWVAALVDRGWPRGWATVLVVPVAAHLATMPVIAAISGTISLVAVLANLLVLPVVAPVLLGGALVAVLGPIWPAGAATVADLLGPLLRWIVRVCHTLADWPWATVPWSSSPLGVIGLAVLLFAVVLLLRHRRARWLAGAVALGALAGLLPARTLLPGWPPADWVLIGCAVGQGDAWLLATGRPGEAVVIDTGPDPEAVNDCLTDAGVHTVPLLVLTHLHADHIGGLAGAVQDRRVDAIAVGPGRNPDQAWSDVADAAAARSVPVLEPAVGERLSIGGLTLTALGPPVRHPGWESNDLSLVLMAQLHGVRILLTGDIEEAGQRALISSGTDLEADVLKQPHHGSAVLLPELIAAVAPRVAVIGVGTDNTFGHPSPTALDALAAVGTDQILRTDTDGTIAVTSRDGDLSVARSGAP